MTKGYFKLLFEEAKTKGFVETDYVTFYLKNGYKFTSPIWNVEYENNIEYARIFYSNTVSRRMTFIPFNSIDSITFSATPDEVQ